ncbi:MAG: DUF1611 domain-containing protein [Melioribacteraceae bacterium]|nr:DUF1611 domain-containing protein [Melioribacteraceae bacterium]MDD3558371.1 DUF1611 domain-containing protein [Melioribacteraceae bacterium]
MNNFPEGTAVVFCEGAFQTPNGKTAHGLVRFTYRYNVLCVIDSTCSGKDAGEVLDGKNRNIPVLASLNEALKFAKNNQIVVTHLVIGLAPDGGRLPDEAKLVIKKAIRKGLNVDSGLHDFLTIDKELVSLARKHNVVLRDIRKTPHRDDLHFFTGKIEEVDSKVIAVLGTDSAIGKRTTAWILVKALNAAGYRTEMIGTGQTAWMQGARYCVIIDSLVNDFVSGELEHAVHSAWKESRPKFIVVEGQGSLLNPAYPGGFEILAATRPDYIILQHAPARKEYDGFPGYHIHSLSKQIKAMEIISGKTVTAITINHENMQIKDVHKECKEIEKLYDIPASDVLLEGGEKIARLLIEKLKKNQ